MVYTAAFKTIVPICSLHTAVYFCIPHRMFDLKPHLPIPGTGKFQPRLLGGYGWPIPAKAFWFNGLGTGASNHLKLLLYLRKSTKKICLALFEPF